jgi:16S rRNA (guanine966-N2)-methyltransferase
MTYISSGKFKGKKVKVPNTPLTRATTSFSRTVIFDTLMSKLEGATVLDLFAGSGSLGIEALSRGANHVIFNDIGKLQMATIKENVAFFGIKDQTTLFQQEALKTLKDLDSHLVDILFLDPPYSIDIDILKAIFSLILEKKILKEGGVVCLETDPLHQTLIKALPLSPFSIYKEKKRGGTLLLFISASL